MKTTCVWYLPSPVTISPSDPSFPHRPRLIFPCLLATVSLSLSLSLSPLPHPLSLSLSLRPLPHLLFTYFFTHSSPPSYRDEICGKIAILELREKKERKKVREKSVVICPSGGKRSQAGMVDEGPREGWMGGCVDGERGVGTVAGREGLNRCRKLGACL